MVITASITEYLSLEICYRYQSWPDFGTVSHGAKLCPPLELEGGKKLPAHAKSRDKSGLVVLVLVQVDTGKQVNTSQHTLLLCRALVSGEW